MRKASCKLGAIGLSAIMIFSFAGCGSSKSTSTASVSSTSKPKATETATPTPTEEVKDISVVSTSSVTEEKKERDEFDKGTISYFCSWLQVQVPDYFVSTYQTEDQTSYLFNAKDESDSVGSLMLTTYTMQEAPTSDTLENVSVSAIKDFINGINTGSYRISTDDLTEAHLATFSEYPACEFKATAQYSDDSKPNTDSVDIHGSLIFKDGSNVGVLVVLLTGNNSKYSYESDYSKILNNLSEMQVTEGASSSSSSSSSDSSDSSQVTPELKEFLDSYEAFVDEYIEFMNKYNQNPTDATLLAQYMDYMTKLADFEKKANDYAAQESQMSTADYNYYIDVTTRCTQKLLQVSADLSKQSQ